MAIELGVPTPTSVTVEVSTRYQPWQACSKKEPSAPQLSGVYVDPAGYLVATDGFILAAVPAAVHGLGTFTGAILPAEALESAAKAVGKSTGTIKLTLDTERNIARGLVLTPKRVIAMADASDMATIALMEGKYLRWRALIPVKESLGAREWIGFDPTLIQRLSKAIGISWPIIITLSQSNGPAIILGDKGAFGLIMPISAHEPDPQFLSQVLGLREESPKDIGEP